MTYTIGQLADDVMTRLGENARPQSTSTLPPGIPTLRSRTEARLAVMLRETGSRLLQEAESGVLRGAESLEPQIKRKRLRCGLYATIIPLPDDFLRLGRLKMESWQVGVEKPISRESSEWTRHLSKEPATAGCPSRPAAYLQPGASGMELMAVGSESQEDTLETCQIWRVPKADADGKFRFPETLYAVLVRDIASELM